MNSNLVAQNKMIKDKISEIQDDIFEMKENSMRKGLKNSLTYEEKEIKVTNKNLRDRLQFLKKREK